MDDDHEEEDGRSSGSVIAQKLRQPAGAVDRGRLVEVARDVLQARPGR